MKKVVSKEKKKIREKGNKFKFNSPFKKEKKNLDTIEENEAKVMEESSKEAVSDIIVIEDDTSTLADLVLNEKSENNNETFEEKIENNNEVFEEKIENIEVIDDNSKEKKSKRKKKKEKKVNDETKKKRKVWPIILVVVILFVGVLSYGGYWYYENYIVAPIPTIKSVSLSEDHILSVKFDVPSYNKHKKIYCLFKTDDKAPTKDDKKWVLSKKNECSTTLSDATYYAYLKNEDNVIYDVKKSSTIGKIVNFELNKEQVYIAVKGNYTVKATLESIGNIDKNITWSSEDESIATVDENGKITGLKKGNTVIHAKVMDNDISTKVMVTDLITVRPKKYDYSKKIVPCGKHTKAENDLLDEILKDRINDAGYKTRAGAVEAGRFLPLEFPYRIRYFSENGRGNTNGVDGEGRYYHVGLYLDESRYANITKTMMGPKTWGCSLYSRPSKGNRPNGLDCSGYISWVLLNGGFDVKDVGAGLNHGGLDLTDYGDRVRFTDEVLNSGKIKVGDLLSSGGPEGGHIAMIVGEDKDFYYVTESLWTPPNVAVVVIAYPKTAAVKKSSKSSYEVVNDRYYWVVLMDKYYKEDGNLTQLWY